jgi:hypothetical protein
MVTQGAGIGNKHMSTRMHLAVEAVQDIRVEIQYVHTSRIIADGLTKPIEGKCFDLFVKKVNKKSTGGH